MTFQDFPEGGMDQPRRDKAHPILNEALLVLAGLVGAIGISILGYKLLIHRYPFLVP